MGLFRKREDVGLTRVQCPECGYEQDIDKGVLSVFCKKCKHRITTSAGSETKGLERPAITTFDVTPEKTTEVQCPQCGTPNKVAEDAVSVFCKKCKNIIKRKQDAPPVKSIGTSSGNGKTKTVTCYSCSNPQSVSTSAMSAFCSSCGNRIDLTDWQIKEIYREKIMTRGNLHVTKQGRVNAEVNVMSARIDGEVRGNIIAEDRIEIGSRGKVFGNVIARRLKLHKGAFYSGNIRLNAGKIPE